MARDKRSLVHMTFKGGAVCRRKTRALVCYWGEVTCPHCLKTYILTAAAVSAPRSISKDSSSLELSVKSVEHMSAKRCTTR